MDTAFNTVKKIGHHYLLALVASVIAELLVLLSLWFYNSSYWTHTTLMVVVASAGFSMQMALVFAIYKIYSENIRLRKIAGEMHQINHYYRDELSKMFLAAQNGKLGEGIDDMLKEEQRVLTAVAQKIANVFTYLSNVKCKVTVELLKKGENGHKCAFDWAVNEFDVVNDKGPKEYKVSENTRLKLALIETTGICCFFGPDLYNLAGYEDHRPVWRDIYAGMIVVPIRFSHPDRQESDDLGVLRVDTKSRNRLNNHHHIEYVAAFADQMYYYMSLMRGRFFKKQTRGGRWTRAGAPLKNQCKI